MSDNLREELLRVKARESRSRKEAETKIASLEEKNSALEAELASAREKSGASASEAQAYKSELEILSQEYRDKEEAAKKLIAETEARLSESREREENARNEIDELRKALAEAKGNMNAAAKTAAKRDQTIAELKQKLDKAKDEISRLKAEANREMEKNDQINKTIDNNLSQLKIKLMAAFRVAEKWEQSFCNIQSPNSLFRSVNPDCPSPEDVLKQIKILKDIQIDRHSHNFLRPNGAISQICENFISHAKKLHNKLKKHRSFSFGWKTGVYDASIIDEKPYLVELVSGIVESKMTLEKTPPDKL
ncbi:MAG: hypothetical protein HDQ93_05480 [Desulfovibrio sp.]|nr:hypothetical protein [Desulfovibrio sp.]